MMTDPHDDGFDRTPEGQALASLLRRHAPGPTDAGRGARAVLSRLQRRRARPLLWLAPAAAVAAAALIVLVVSLPRTQPVETPAPAPVVPAAQGTAPALTAMVRGGSGDGWRIDAGLKDGLRVGDVLEGPGARAVITAVGIFDARVRVQGRPPQLGDRFALEAPTAPTRRAARFAHLGGDPGGFYDLGAVLDPLPFAEALSLGMADGRALRVVEIIPSILRDHAGQPEPPLASRLGLRAGDVIEAVNGRPVGDLAELANALDESRHRETSVIVLRNSTPTELRAR